MNTFAFLSDLRSAYERADVTQSVLAKTYGLNQGSISRLLSESNNLKASTMIALWPFVYGRPFPEKGSPADPTPQEEDA